METQENMFKRFIDEVAMQEYGLSTGILLISACNGERL